MPLKSPDSPLSGPCPLPHHEGGLPPLLTDAQGLGSVAIGSKLRSLETPKRPSSAPSSSPRRRSGYSDVRISSVPAFLIVLITLYSTVSIHRPRNCYSKPFARRFDHTGPELGNYQTVCRPPRESPPFDYSPGARIAQRRCWDQVPQSLGPRAAR